MAQEIGNLRTKLSFDKTGDSNLTDLTRDLKGVRSEMNNFRASGRAYRTSVKGMKEESDILSRRLQVQRERVAELARRYEESKRVNGENAAATKDLAAQYNNAQAQAKNTEQQLSRLNEMIRTQESRWTKLGDAMIKSGDKLKTFGTATSRFGRQYTMRVTTPILAAGAAAIKVGMDFEEGMSKVEAISGASGKDLESLKELAKDMGATTRFSATQAAEGLEYMALAGWETKEMLDGLPGVLDLAAASGEDLGRTSDIVTDGLSAFGMEAKESARFADVLAAASANANTDVSGLGAAFQYVAPVAGALGFNIEDTATAIGLMSDNGIKGQKAGTALRTMMTNLAKPTEAMQKQMDKLNISLTDGEGEMKSFDEIMQDLRKGFSGLTEEQQASAAATIFGKESMSGALAIIGTTDDEYNKLSKSIADSNGAASEMAEVMQDNAKGAMIEFKSALEGIGIEASEHMLPALTDIIKGATDLVRKFGDLDDEQQKQILKWAGIAAAVGPASIVLGHTATGLGNVLTFGGKVSKMLGRASGAGLIGRFGLMGGPTGVAVVAAAGVGLLAYKMIDAHKESEKLKEVSTETAEKLTEQADTLEELTDKFDGLKTQSKFTNDEFAELIDITKELETTQNPARIADLQEQYEELAKKSGMSNDELSEMVDLNDELVEKTPELEESFTKRGNAIAGTTDEMRELIQSYRDLAIEEMRDEINQGLINEKEHLKDIKQYKQELKDIDGEILELEKLREQPLEETKERISEINDLLMDGTLEIEEHDALQDELNLLRVAENELIDETLNGLYDKKGAIRDNIKDSQEELEKLEEAKVYYADLLLAELDINWEKGKGLEKLDDRIGKLKEERDEILNNMSEEDRRHGKFDEHLADLDESISKHETVRDKIKEETGFLSEHNAEQEQTKYLLGLQGEEYDKNIGKLDIENIKARENHETLTKPATKLLTVDDNGTIKSVNDRATEKKTKGIGLVAPGLARFNQDITAPVTKTVRLAASGMQGVLGTLRGYATGTDNHPGGPFIAGEEGYELGRMGNRWEMLNFGMYDRPRGYEVFPHNESKRILNAMNNIPKYANGTSNRSPVNAINDDTSQIASNTMIGALLERIAIGVEKGQSIKVNGKEIARATADDMDREMSSTSGRRAAAWGG